MRVLTTTVVTLFSISSSGLASLSIDKYAGQTTGLHIVQLKDGADKASLLSHVKAANGQVTHTWDLINGFAVVLNPTVLDLILASPLVRSISEDGIMHTSGIQRNSTWGLARISDPKPIDSSLSLSPGPDPTALIYDYCYPNDDLGSDVDIYIVDTGVRTTHEAFDSGRATWGWVVPTLNPEDGNGHGTHVAGTAAGKRFGVAQNASIIAVKAMGDNGSGNVSDIISGLDWLNAQANNTGRSSIVNMSLAGFVSKPLDDAVNKLTDAGIHVVVAAGNDGSDADLYSPARASSAVTVGASNIKDQRALFSNHGPPVKVFAPGVDVVSAWNTADNATNHISGTSMATPHISGLIAYLINANGGAKIAPARMIDMIKNLTLKNALFGVPPLTTKNYLAQNQEAANFTDWTTGTSQLLTKGDIRSLM